MKRASKSADINVDNVDQAKQKKPSAPSPPSATYVFLVGLLCSGTTVALISQVIVNQAATNPGAQLQTLSKYLFTFLISSFLSFVNRPTSTTPARSSTTTNPKAPSSAIWPRLSLLTIGIFDVLGYGLYIYGFAACGSALSTIIMAAAGQLCTAVLSVAVLKRKLSKQHVAAVALVALGLMLRSGSSLFASGGSSTNSSSSSTAGYSQTGGALLVALASVLYSCLGVMYEHMMTTHAGVYTHNQVGFYSSAIGLAAMLLYQALVTWPNRHNLLLQPLTSSKTSLSDVALIHAAYGAIYTIHFYLQAFVLQLQGALAVGLVNACRATVVSLVTHALFCGHPGAQHCLTKWLAGSAVVVTCGAVCWVKAGKPKAEDEGTPVKVD